MDIYSFSRLDEKQLMHWMDDKAKLSTEGYLALKAKYEPMVQFGDYIIRFCPLGAYLISKFEVHKLY
jgi:hypothetical protein